MSEESLDQKNIEVISVPFSESLSETVSDQNSISETIKKPELVKQNSKSKNVNKHETVVSVSLSESSISKSSLSEKENNSENVSESVVDVTEKSSSSEAASTSSYSTYSYHGSQISSANNVSVWKKKTTKRIFYDFAVFFMVVVITLVFGTIFLRREPDLTC